MVTARQSLSDSKTFTNESQRDPMFPVRVRLRARSPM